MNKCIEELIELSKENPELEIKFNISGDCNEDDNSWYVGDINFVKVDDYIEYDGIIYDDEESVKEMISDDFTVEEAAHLTPDEYLELIEKKFQELEQKKVIWVHVGV